VSKTASIPDGAYTFEMADTYGDGICRQYGAGDFNISVNGEPGANSSSGGFRDVVRKWFDVVGLSTAYTVDFQMDVAYEDYMHETSWRLVTLMPRLILRQSPSLVICCRRICRLSRLSFCHAAVLRKRMRALVYEVTSLFVRTYEYGAALLQDHLFGLGICEGCSSFVVGCLGN
jgi:hypothetical protein